MATVKLIVKNPSRPEGFVLGDVPLAATLAEVQDLIYKNYPGNPPPSDQTLIYAGKVLKEPRITLQQLVAKLDPDGSGPCSLHLVVKPHSGASSSTSTPFPAPVQQPTQTPQAQANPSATATPSAPRSQPAAAAAPPPGNPPPPQQWAQAPNHAQFMGAFPHGPQVPTQHSLPYLYLNPIVATAYQAAYTAALAAGACTQVQQAASQPEASGAPSSSSGVKDEGTSAPGPSTPSVSPAVAGAAAAMTSLRPMSPWPMHSLAFTQAYLASMNSLAALNTQGASPTPPDAQQQHQRIIQLLMGQPGLMQYPPQMLYQQHPQQHLLNMNVLFQQHNAIPVTMAVNGMGDMALGAQPGTANNQNNAANVRNRRNAAAAAMVQAAAAPAAAIRPQRPRRQRVFTLRINMRMLLQLLVFGMVLYQHFTWRRFVMLVVIALALWVTSLAPLRRLVASLQAPPPQAAPLPPRPAAGAEAAAGADTPQAGGGLAPQPQNRGILGEIIVIIVGFMTSLLPAWNYNPEDAAAFAAAQEGAQPPAPVQRENNNNNDNNQAEQPVAPAPEQQPPAGEAPAAAAPHAHQD